MKNSTANKLDFKCARCKICDGRTCIGQMPGMGGVNNNKNFKLNYIAWRLLREKAIADGTIEKIKSISIDESVVSLGPVTGAVQNIGFIDEENFYLPYFSAAQKAGIDICVGDGFPDYKLKLGLEAIRKLQQIDSNLKGIFFLKPYENKKLFERIELVQDDAKIIGNDIDSYNIVTMRNLVNLEKKTPVQIAELRKHLKLPYAIKGIFCKEDIELVKEVKPDIAFISNHGGRVETREGSTADFLVEYAKELKNYCGEIWVDGGVRCKEDIQTALFYGAKKVIIARPFIAALVANGIAGMTKKINEIIYS